MFRFSHLLFILGAFWGAFWLVACDSNTLQTVEPVPSPTETALGVCEILTFEETPISVCRAAPGALHLKLVHLDDSGEHYGQFANVLAAFEDQHVGFAMNGGMYHNDRSPVGLYVENGVQTRSIVLRAGPGNFGLLPNGVFYISNGVPAVSESHAFQTQFGDTPPEFATQSGPMLVINGALHPKFKEDSTSRKPRNGVGVADDGTAFFAISNTPVTFHFFARFFRDGLETPNALFLDGVVSKLHAPDLGRSDVGLDMGPIIVAVSPPDATSAED